MDPVQILHAHNLKRTSCREGILAVIMKSDRALSENEIRERLQGNYDRTTFYRSFNTLEENHILHKIVVDSQVVKYAFVNPSMDLHAHFYCTECRTVRCLEAVTFRKPALPDGYSGYGTEVLIKGRCSSCNNTGGQP